MDLQHVKRRSGRSIMAGMVFALIISDANARCHATSEKMEKTRQSPMQTPSRPTRILLRYSDRCDGLHDLRIHGHLQGCRKEQAHRGSVSLGTAQRKLICFHLSRL